MRPNRIPREVFDAAVAARDPDQLIELLRPYVARPRGVKPTIGWKDMTAEDRRLYYAEWRKRKAK